MNLSLQNNLALSTLQLTDVIDHSGGIWQFSSSTNTWNYIGTIGSSGLVSVTGDGLEVRRLLVLRHQLPANSKAYHDVAVETVLRPALEILSH